MIRQFSVVLLVLVGSLSAFPMTITASSFHDRTIRVDIQASDVAVIAVATHGPDERNDMGMVTFSVEDVLHGAKHSEGVTEVKTIYFGKFEKGDRFLLLGGDAPEVVWSAEHLSKRGAAYTKQIARLLDDEVARLAFCLQHLRDSDDSVASDARLEFSIAPYSAVKQLKPNLNHDRLVEWLVDPSVESSLKRLYFKMLGICGSEKDLPMLEGILRNAKDDQALDGAIGCYLSLGGADVLPLVNELYLANRQSSFVHAYSAILAVRFHIDQENIIPRKVLLESIQLVLQRSELADLVVADLARWEDWSQVDRLVKMYAEADPNENWIRVPVINYMRKCPLPVAEDVLKKLKAIDPKAFKRAETFYPAADPQKVKELSETSSSQQ